MQSKDYTLENSSYIVNDIDNIVVYNNCDEGNISYRLWRTKDLIIKAKYDGEIWKIYYPDGSIFEKLIGSKKGILWDSEDHIMGLFDYNDALKNSLKYKDYITNNNMLPTIEPKIEADGTVMSRGARRSSSSKIVGTISPDNPNLILDVEENLSKLLNQTLDIEYVIHYFHEHVLRSVNEILSRNCKAEYKQEQKKLEATTEKKLKKVLNFQIPFANILNPDPNKVSFVNVVESLLASKQDKIEQNHDKEELELDEEYLQLMETEAKEKAMYREMLKEDRALFDLMVSYMTQKQTELTKMEQQQNAKIAPKHNYFLNVDTGIYPKAKRAK